MIPTKNSLQTIFVEITNLSHPDLFLELNKHPKVTFNSALIDFFTKH